MASHTMNVGAFGLDVSRVRWTRNGILRGTLTLLDSQKRVLLVTETNINSIDDRQRLIEALDKAIGSNARASQLAESWAPTIAQAFAAIVDKESMSDAPVRLKDIPRPDKARFAWLGEFPVLLDHPTVIFGDGSSGKSFFTLWLVSQLAQKGHRVLWLDYEMSGSDHRLRLEDLYGADNMPDDIFYKSCDAPFTRIGESLKDDIERDGIDFVVIDSAGVAVEGNPSDADVANAFFQTLRGLGRVGSIVIAHQTKDSDGSKPFGSAFWHNCARLTWHVEPTRLNEGAHATMQLQLKKDNFAVLPKDHKLTYDIFKADGKSSIELTDNSKPAVTCAGKVLMLLKEQGPMTMVALQQQLQDVKPDTLRRTIDRHEDEFETAEGWVRLRT